MGIELPANVAEAQAKTVREIYETGSVVNSAGDENGFVELLGYTTGMSNPRARVGVGARPLPTVGAVARFVWLVAGSDRLEDIAYYESKVRPYTDDGLSVPGSSYGKRIFNASPGTNQMTGIVEELKQKPDSRRAAAVVWLPEDAVRISNDIPCTFGLFFHIRENKLTMTTVMRSNNAVTLVPYNFFEFSMIGEMVSAEVGVEFDRYVHWAASMHTIDKQNAVRDAVLANDDPQAIEMPPMPHGDALRSAYALAQFEARLRHAGTQAELIHVAGEAREQLGDYWGGMFNVLYVHGLAKRGLKDETWAEFEKVPSYFQEGARGALELVLNEVLGAQMDTTSDVDSLFSVIEPLAAGSAARVSEAASRASDTDWVVTALQSLSLDEPATVDELVAVRDALRQGDVTLAARFAAGATELTARDVADALHRIRSAEGS